MSCVRLTSPDPKKKASHTAEAHVRDGGRSRRFPERLEPGLREMVDIAPF